MKIKSIELKDFKGTKSAFYEFDKKSAKVSGKNGVGKTTIADAFFYLFCGRDNNLTKNPEIFPIDMEEAQPMVRCTVDINDVEHVLSKWQVRKKKKKSDGTVEISTINEFSINEVPKSATTFDEFLKEHGIDSDKFLQFSHPDVFVSQMENKKERELMRATLFSMANSHSDVDIARMDESTKEVADLLTKYAMEEIRAMYATQKKKAVENVENIPQQIIGLEMAKTDIDVAEYELLKADCERKIKELEEELALNDSIVLFGRLQAQKDTLLSKINSIQVEENLKLANRTMEVKKSISELNTKMHEQEISKMVLENKIKELESVIATEKSNRESYGVKYHEAEKREFDESVWVYDEKSDTCPACGQKLPDEKIKSAHEQFEKNHLLAKEHFAKEKRILMNEMIEKGNNSKSLSSVAEEKLESSKKEHSEISLSLEIIAKQKKDMIDNLSKMPLSADLTNDERIIELNNEIARIGKEINEITISDNSLIKNQICEFKNQLSVANEKIASVNNNVRIDEQIESLRSDQRSAEQKKADAEKILFQIDEVSKRKNSMLSDEINKHFNFVNFIFFDYQKNGGYIECCIPTVNGKRLGESMNTGLELMAKLDIINGLQKFYNAEIPVIVDGAEALDNSNLDKLISDDLQTIFLRVSDDDMKVEVA